MKWNKTPVTAKVSISYTICSIIQRSLSIITLPLFTRLLTTEQYGQVTVYSTWSSLLVIFLTLQLPYGSFSTAMIKFEKCRNEYLASAEGVCLFISALFLAIYIPFHAIWNKMFELPTTIMVIMVVDILAGSGIAFWSGKKRFEYKYKEVIAVTLAISLLSPALQYVLVMNAEEKGYARIVGGAIVNTIFGGSLFIIGLVRGKKVFDRYLWKYALSFNLPLLAYYLSQMIFNSSDKLMISHMVGKDKAAVYGVAYNLAVMLNFVLVSINNSYVPWFYEKLKKRRQDENRPIANFIAILMAILLLGVIWFAPEIIYIMAGDDYAEAIWVVPPVAMSVLLLFYSQLSINIEFYFEEKRMLVGASILAALTNIVLNYLFIPFAGYFIAGYTTLVSYLVFAAANYYNMKKVLSRNRITNHGFSVMGLLLIYLAFLIVGALGVFLYKVFIIRIVIACVVLIIVIFNRKVFLRYWNSIRLKDV